MATCCASSGVRGSLKPPALGPPCQSHRLGFGVPSNSVRHRGTISHQPRKGRGLLKAQEEQPSGREEQQEWCSAEPDRRLAALRVLDAHPDEDPISAALAGEEAILPERDTDAAAKAAGYAVASRYLDEAILQAVAFVTNNRDYRQVVLVGAATDTRPYRLPWPEGTVIYHIAAPNAHQEAAAALKSVPQAKVPKGSLHRRVPANLQGGSGFCEQLELAGFQSERLSIWSLQGLHELGLDKQGYRNLLLDISDLAAFGSQVCGEVHAEDASVVEEMMASLGLLGNVIPLEAMAAKYGRLWDLQRSAETQDMPTRRWLFHGEQKRLSLSQMDKYNAHVAAAEAADEDFFDNFS